MTKLKMMREKAGLTQLQLSEKTGIHYRTLQYYEQGQMNFDHAKVDKILSAAIVLNCGIEDLIEDQSMIEKVKEYQASL